MMALEKHQGCSSGVGWLLLIAIYAVMSIFADKEENNLKIEATWPKPLKKKVRIHM